MKIHQLSVHEAFASIQSGNYGLTATEAGRRFAEFGPNEVERAYREPVALRFVKEFGHFFPIILWIPAALAFVAEYREPGEGMATLGFAIIGVIVVNGLFSFCQAYRAEKAVEALQRLLPLATKVVRGRTCPLQRSRH
jgi:sodium/potassium-transporting ATPase subunit alpha